MKLRVFLVIIAVALLAGGVYFYVRHHVRRVPMILANASVYTVYPAQPHAQAVAIQDGIIVGVGPTRELLARFKADTVIDLGGKPVYPGFIDSHAHLEALGVMLMNLEVGSAPSANDVALEVAGAVAARPAGAWIRGRGWDQNRWPGKKFPDKTILDRVAPHNPVMLARVDGHAVWVNSQVLSMGGITSSTPDPVGGRIIRDVRGNPTGVLLDNAVQLLRSVLPRPSKEERASAVKLAQSLCLRYGLTQVHDMGVDAEMIRIYRDLMESGNFPLRIYAAVEGGGTVWENVRSAGPETEHGNSRLAVRAVKVYMDGALGSRGAALLLPYADEPANRGLTLMSADSLKRLAADCAAKGFQLCVHAIGDRANGIVLKAYADAFAMSGTNGNDVRYRIEHAQVLDAADVPAFHRLGVIPVMQAAQCTSDFSWIEDRLGTRAGRAYLWRTLIDDGNIIPGGSDFPVESPDPLVGFYAAVTRQNVDGLPQGGWHAAECMTREEALKSYTIWGSYAAFEEEVKGSIEVGKWADLVILSEDIMTIDPARIPSVTVEKTMIGGTFVYERPAGNDEHASWMGSSNGLGPRNSKP